MERNDVNIDAAFENFQRILEEVGSAKGTIITEQDTRLKVIDPILTKVLGWPLAEISTEEQAGSGFVDYKLTINGFARMVLEAKRDGKDLGFEGQSSVRAFKLNGPVFNAPLAKKGIDQATGYCGQKNSELACVTNGREWAVFRGSRLGDGLDTLEGVGFVFSSLTSISGNFKLFFELLSYDSVSRFQYRAYFQEAEGKPIRRLEFKRALRSPESRKLLSHDRLSGDIDRVMTSFFRRLSGDEDPDLLTECFVVTRESEIADRTLARISEDLAGRIRNLDTQDADELTELIERVRKTQRNEFVLLIGTKGAGKSTFIDRFFKTVLPKPILKDCIICKINLGDNEGDESVLIEWLNHKLLDALENAIFGNQSPSFEDIQGMFFDDYKRWSKGTLRPLYERDRDGFRIKFGMHVEQRREERPNEYIQRLLSHIVTVRKKLPCIVFDNADHFTIEFQERVFQYARSLYERVLCLVIMPITDRTSWHMSREDALRSFENESLFLPTPSPKRVLERRITFIENKIEEEKKEPGRRYFVGKGIHLSLEDLGKFSRVLQSVFLNTGSVSRWIGSLANGDVRQCLELAKDVSTSPHIGVEELLKLYVDESSFYTPVWKIRNAIIRRKYDIYPEGDNRFVQNIFWLDDETESSPLLGLRILNLLRDTRRADKGDNFITVNQTIEYFRAMHVEPTTLMPWLNKMLETGLCLSYDPTITSIKNAQKIELAPAGSQHLWWGTKEPDYLQAMMQVSPIVERAVYENLEELRRQPRKQVWHRELELFLEYLISEDHRFCSVPDHAAYVTQLRVHQVLRYMLRKKSRPNWRRSSSRSPAKNQG